DLRKDIRTSTRVASATYDERRKGWEVETDEGASLQSRFLIFATGCLSVPVEPDIAGLEAFHGPVYRTSTWPDHPVDFRGKRVAVVGTGSSGIQAIPVIAQEAEHLYVLQRTPNYSVPGYNAPMDPEYERDWKKNY